MQRLVAVRFGNSDVIFNAARTWFVQTVHLAQDAITGIHILNDHAKRIDVHNRMETLLFQHHFAVNRIQMFFATAYATRNACFLQTPVNLGENFLDHLLTVAARGFHHFFNHAITVRVERFKTQFFQFGFQMVNTETVGQRAINFQCFTSDAATFIRT